MDEQALRPVPIKRELKVETQLPPQITSETWMLMLGTALFFDATGALVNLIPLAGIILEEANDLFADGVFWLWFTTKGSKYSKTTLFGGFILKLIPFIDILPEYTLSIVLLYFQAKAKKAEQKVPGAKQVMKQVQKAA